MASMAEPRSASSSDRKADENTPLLHEQHANTTTNTTTSSSSSGSKAGGSGHGNTTTTTTTSSGSGPRNANSASTIDIDIVITNNVDNDIDRILTTTTTTISNINTTFFRPRDQDMLTFPPGDPENPRNWPERRKWFVLSPIILVDLAVSWGASGYSPAKERFMEAFGVGQTTGTLGLSLYILGLALGPMLLAPLSERFGRSLLYIVPFGIYVVLLMVTAVVDNVAGFMVLRVCSGLTSGVTIANLGGTVADMWPRHRVGIPVSWWMWAAVAGSPSGYFLMSLVVGMDEDGTWRDVFWALGGICGGLWLIMTVVLIAGGNETRHSILLKKRAAKLREEHNTSHDDVTELRKSDNGLGRSSEGSFASLFKVTLTRPFRLLFSEIIIVFAALYNGYLYGLSFLFNGAYPLVFGSTGYGFGSIGVGTCFLGFFFGVCVGPFTYLFQESYYRRRIHEIDPPRPDMQPDEDGFYKNLPESRVQSGKIAAITLPLSLWWFAWTIVPSYHIHCVVPILATTLFGWSFYNLILMTYLYVEDSYMIFSASALAGVGLVRNLAGATFPLFGRQMFLGLGYNWAVSVLAGLSMLLIPIPFILERYGVRLRAKSPWASQAMD